MMSTLMPLPACLLVCLLFVFSYDCLSSDPEQASLNQTAWFSLFLFVIFLLLLQEAAKIYSSVLLASSKKLMLEVSSEPILKLFLSLRLRTLR